MANQPKNSVLKPEWPAIELYIRLDIALLAGLFLAKLFLHLALSGRYGYHGDELYFIESGKHLAFGYVDNPPLAPWLARLSGVLFGYSLFGLRFFSALAGALAVLLTVLIVRPLRRWPCQFCRLKHRIV